MALEKFLLFFLFLPASLAPRRSFWSEAGHRYWMKKHVGQLRFGSSIFRRNYTGSFATRMKVQEIQTGWKI